MEFETVVATRRSVRLFDDRDVPEDVLERVLEAARLAPSANNRQPWHFIVVRDVDTRRELAELAGQQLFIADAPVVLVCCGQRYRSPHYWLHDYLYVVDLTIAIDHLTLAARDQGLGTCWIGAFDHDPIKSLLEVPGTHDIVRLIPLGYPERESQFCETTDRLPLDKIVSRERFGG